MIAVDSNVLVRLLVRDDEAQVRRALDLLEQSRDNGEMWLITAPVLCELEWVLRAAFKVPRSEIVAVIQSLLGDDAFEIESRDATVEALERFRRGKGDFSDHLIGTLARHHGARTTYTFDRALRRDPDFSIL